MGASHPDGPCVAIGASRNGAPLGLAFGQIGNPVSDMHSLFVVNAERGRGAGTNLLTMLEKEMGRLGARRLRCCFLEKPGQSPALARVLEKRGWPAPAPHKVFAKFAVTRMLEAPFSREYKLSPGFSVALWRDITPSQREALRLECETLDWVPASLVPFKFERALEERNSLVLLLDGRVVGWQLTQRLHPETLSYSCSYMHPRLQTRGLILKLYVETMRLQVRDAPEYPNAYFVVPVQFKGMVGFTRNRLGPFLSELGVFQETIKNVDSSLIPSISGP